MVYKKEGLLRRIEKLREYRHDIKELRNTTFEQYVKDKKLKYSIERLLFLIAENMIDFLDYILSSRFELISDSYEEIIGNAYKKNLIDTSFYSQIKGLGGFRNILAHEYLNISDEEVFRNFRKMTDIIDEAVERFERMI